MDTTKQAIVETGKASTPAAEPKCTALIEAGIVTAQDFAGAMSAMMSDIVTGRIDPQVANAVCNAGGKLLKAVEMQYKFGTKGDSTSNRKSLKLVEQKDDAA